MQVYTEKGEIIENPDDDEAGLYLVHHMHHIKRDGEIVHELHHCPLYSKKSMQGQKYKIEHRLNGNQAVHYVRGQFSGKLYDHANNAYTIKDGTIL
jgi:hypothetical protein